MKPGTSNVMVLRNGNEAPQTSQEGVPYLGFSSSKLVNKKESEQEVKGTRNTRKKCLLLFWFYEADMSTALFIVIIINNLE